MGSKKGQKHKKIKDYTNMKFGNLLAIRATQERYRGGVVWEFLCDCGKKTFKPIGSVKTGNVKSCGCLNESKNRSGRVTKHGKSRSSEYGIWRNMLRRCHCENDASYSLYGGKGIKVCERWLKSFKNFYVDMGDRPSNRHSLDRINSDEGYFRNNCRWVNGTVQAINRKQHNNHNGIPGVRYNKSSKTWFVEIYLFSKRAYLGTFPDFFEACCIRKSAENNSQYSDIYSSRIL